MLDREEFFVVNGEVVEQAGKMAADVREVAIDFEGPAPTLGASVGRKAEHSMAIVRPAGQSGPLGEPAEA